MLVSVIITTYKHKDFIDKTISSIINQSYENRELIIGDDSPDDNTWNIIHKYVKKFPNKIKAYHNNPGKGIVGNIKFLLDKIDEHSDFVAFLEGDDIYMPNNLSTKINIFKKYKEVGLVYNECSIINDLGDVTTKKFLKSQGCKYFYKNEKIDLEKALCELRPLYHSWSTIMVRTEIIKKYSITIPVLENRSLVSDFIFFMNVGSNEKIYGIEEALTGYRVHSNNLSGSVNNSLSNDLLEVFKYYYEIGAITNKTFKKGSVICYSTLFLHFLKNSFKFLFKSIKSSFFYTIYVILYKLRTYILMRKK